MLPAAEDSANGEIRLYAQPGLMASCHLSPFGPVRQNWSLIGLIGNGRAAKMAAEAASEASAAS